MSKQSYFTESRRITPWTDCDDPTPVQAFIDDVVGYVYEERHPRLKDSGEAEFINHYVPDDCPYCGSSEYVRFGFTKNGIRRYKCPRCSRTFTPVTGTIFQDHKISISQWIDFCLALFRNQSFTSISKANRNSYTTTRYWISKLFMLLEDYQQGIVLEGDIYIDETYFKVRKGDIQKVDGKERRGLSSNQICIAIGWDSKHLYIQVEGTGKPSQKKTWAAFAEHIKPGSHLIHDEEKAHSILVRNLELTSETYNSKEMKKLPDHDNPLNPINRKCDDLKKFLKSHSGFIREDLQGYLNVYAFIINEVRNPYIKVEKLLDIAMHCRKSLTFRENYANKRSI